MGERIEPSEPWHQQFADPDPSLNLENNVSPNMSMKRSEAGNLEAAP